MQHPKKLKIAVYAISKNEASFVQRFYDSCKGADLILLADTGSTDSTVQHARELGMCVYNISIVPWRFDRARDAALALLPPDIDVCISLDLDEVLEPGWREIIESVWQADTTRLRYVYDWGQDLRFMYDKIHARVGYTWHHPCHEYPRPDSRIQEKFAETPRLLVRHLPDNTKSRGQYLDLLHLATVEDPNCSRNAFYYARELSFNGNWALAAEKFQQYLAMPQATWLHERCYAMRLLGRCFESQPQPDNNTALKWYMLATIEAPGTREPWYDLAMFCHRTAQWTLCYHAALQALSITGKELVYTCDPAAWGSAPADLASIAAWQLGLPDVAIEYAKMAAAIDPTNDRIRQNLEFMLEVN